MKLIVGLGNIGPKYDFTRHNIGFESVDRIVSALGLDLNFKKFDESAVILKTQILHESIIFCKPSLFMNNSGVGVKRVKDYYSVDVSDILVIVDDYDLNIGNIRLKPSGSSGGHNGLKSIISHLGVDSFSRLKIGIKNNYNCELSNFVLSRFMKEEESILEIVLKDVTDAVKFWIKEGNDFVMKKYNKKNL